MCGITGIVAFNEIGRINMIHLANATAALEKRGPDNQGHFNDDFVGLGHRRLSIIDMSHEANQPMYDETGRYKIVFNGEIYNYKELRQELITAGVSFRTSSDTEVLLKLFIHEGKSCLQKLNGFFAFSIYDSSKNVVFIARDRMGIKPLLYFQDSDKIVFASEMKALLAFGIERKLNYSTLNLYLQLNYIPAPHSMLMGVKKLMPGHYIEIIDGNVHVEQYYKVPFDSNNLNPKKLSYEQQQKRLVELMEESVKKRLVSDVPLGCFLSGGIDSSIITALASRHREHLNTFSIGYKDEPYFDETKYARLVANKYKTEHTVFSLTNNDIYKHLSEVLNYIDEPFADSSALAVYVLSRETRKIATVALSGDGADELFSGYNKHAAFLRAIQGGGGANIAGKFLPIWKLMPKSRNNPLGNKFRQLQRFAEGVKLNPKERYWRWASVSSEEEANSLLSNISRNSLDKLESEEYRNEILNEITKEDINQILYTDCQLVLPNDMLTKVDLMSMANSLEVRVPFLDNEVVKFAFELPADSKINGQMKKRILQDAFRDLLPPELYKRPKHGFEVPLLKWFRGDLRSMIEDDLLSEQFVLDQGVFDANEVENLKKQLFSSNPNDSVARIWGLLVFQHWWKKWM